MSRKKNPAGLSLCSLKPEPSLPMEHSETAVRLNQDIFRIKTEKQANKEIMFADDIRLLASLPGSVERCERTKRNEGVVQRLPPFPGGGGSCSHILCLG